MCADVLLIIVALGVGPLRIAWFVWSRKVCHRRIRQWADAHDCAVLRLEYRWSPIALLAFWVLGWIPFYQYGSWCALIQDDEGAQRWAWITFGRWWWLDLPWREIHVRWQ